MALSVGVTPVGTPAPPRYRRFAVEPILPDDVIDIGADVSAPSLELLRALKPDLILVNRGIAATAGDTLSLVAPLAVPSRGFQTLNGNPFEAAIEEHLATSEALDRVREGESYRDNVITLLDSLSRRVRSVTSRPLLILWSVDSRHSYVLVRNSIFQGALDRLGLANAWQGVAMPLGMSVVGLEQIAPLEAATIVVIEGSGNVSETIASPLWQALRPVRERRVITLPPMWTVGGLPVAERFARHLVPALERLEAGHG
ncbi:ABC transporter substrate-binding protein [Agrobacterium tumefaciens]|nr:ABC transporter substrate-binding protein [Agrobacterium tumefaciens]